jgi:MFS family permease
VTTPESHGGRFSTRSAWFVVAILLLANLSFWIDRQILALLVKPIQRDLGLSLTQVGVLSGVPFAIFSTVMGFPIARLADTTSRRLVIAVGVALWSVMTALCGLAGSFYRLLLTRIGVGVGESTLQPAATSAIADLFPPARLGTAMSVYSTGSFIGSGLAYAIGGWVVGVVAGQEFWTAPLVGAVRPWQAVFFIVGLPGLLVAALMLFVREPERDRSRGTVPLSSLVRYVRANLRTFVTLSLGYASSLTVNIGISIWLATFLIQSHGWSVTRAGVVQGSLTITMGTLGVVMGGRVADMLARHGHTDAPLRVGIIGAIGMLVSATAYPFAETAAVAVAWLVVVNFFAAFPWGAASAAIAETVPAPMRAQGTALCFVVVNLISVGVGPVAVAAIADHVFHRDSAIREALAIVNVVGMIAAIVLLMYGLSAFRRTMAIRDDWKSD